MPDTDNEGHPGWTIAQVKNGLDADRWLETYKPDIILLHIGTNDIKHGSAASAPANLSALLNDILKRLPAARVLVAQIIPFRRGLGPAIGSYNAAISGIVSSKGTRVSVVDMQNILSKNDYADGLRPNVSGYEKMARAWETAILSVIAPDETIEPAAASPPSLAGTVRAPTPASPQKAAMTPVLRYAPGSTVKLEQLVGEHDKQLNQLTHSQTDTRYQIQGTDLGYSFDHEGQIYFLFGDTIGRLDRALDTLATTNASDPERGVRLDFLTEGNRYLTVQPPGVSTGPFEVPVSGISLAGQMYVVVSTNHSLDRTTDRSVLTKFTPPATFTPLPTISQLPSGRFIKMSLQAEPGPIPGLPAGGPFILIWGTGAYRKSDAYLSIVPAANFETGKGTRYYAGMDDAGKPPWGESEANALPIVRNGTMGDLSVTWCKDLNMWLVTYDSRPPVLPGVLFSYSLAPWGPWKEPQVIFNAVRDGALGRFIYDPQVKPDDGMAGPVTGKRKADPRSVHGGAYAPYVVERWTKLHGAELDLYYVLSTWCRRRLRRRDADSRADGNDPACPYFALAVSHCTNRYSESEP